MENNKKILRDYLAIDRTKLANQRTILSFIRTSIMILASGITLIKFISKDDLLFYIGEISIIASIILFILGLFNYMKFNKKIKKSYSQ